MRTIGDFNPVGPRGFDGGRPCPENADAVVEALRFREPSAGGEGCLVRSGVLERLRLLGASTELRLADETLFERQSLRVGTSSVDQRGSDTAPVIDAPRLYCVSTDGGPKPSIVRATLLERAAPPLRPSPHPVELPRSLTCAEDSDCLAVERTCTARELAEDIARRSGKPVREGVCVCLRGPVVRGCVPRDTVKHEPPW